MLPVECHLDGLVRNPHQKAFPAETVLQLLGQLHFVLFQQLKRHFHISFGTLIFSGAIGFPGLVQQAFYRGAYAGLYNLFAPNIHAVGSMENFIYDYFIRPIEEHSGYNYVNTLVYAAIAIVAVYAIYRTLRGKIKINEKFIGSVLCFVLFGSTVRVVTDAIHTGVFKPITPIHAFVLDSHIWEYPPAGAQLSEFWKFWTVTPGIYILTALLLLISLAILYRMKRVEWLGYVGLALWLPHFLLLVPFFGYALYSIPILVLAAIPAAIAWVYFKDRLLTAIVAGQALDGAATFFVIDVFSKVSTCSIPYSEQHVLSGGIGDIAGYFVFYLVKVIIALAAAHLIKKEKIDQEEKNYIALALMIMGFAPGIRDMLRMVACT